MNRRPPNRAREVQNLPGHEHSCIEQRRAGSEEGDRGDRRARELLRRRSGAQRNPAPAGQQPKSPDPAELAKIETETTKRIQETVRNLLPPVIEGTNPYPHITVSTYTDLPAAPRSAEPRGSGRATGSPTTGGRWG